MTTINEHQTMTPNQLRDALGGINAGDPNELHRACLVICTILAGHEADLVRLETRDDSQRPSVLYRPTLTVDGNQWCALYGENLQDGFAGFGDSPAAAMRNFDDNWNTDLPAAKKGQS